MKKKSVLFYLDNYTPSMKSLSFEQKGMLFDAIVSYGGGIADMPEDMGLLSLAFDPIKATMDRDQEKYEQVCERNRKNGLKGGKPKQTQPNPLGSSGLDSKPTGTKANPNKPDKDKDKDTIQTKIQKEHIPPDGGDSEKPKKPRIEYDPRFESFWNKYPKRNNKRLGKPSAFKEWQKAIKKEGITPEFIESAILFLAPGYGDHPKDAERWLKKELYLDYEEHQDQNEQDPFSAEKIIHGILNAQETIRKRNEDRLKRLSENGNNGEEQYDIPF